MKHPDFEDVLKISKCFFSGVKEFKFPAEFLATSVTTSGVHQRSSHRSVLIF
jgi:hypothetical protein